MASRRLRQHVLGRLQWQLKTTAKTDTVPSGHSVRTCALQRQIPRIDLKRWTSCQTKYLPKLLATPSFLNRGLEHSSRPAGYGFQRLQSRLVSTVSPSENQHNPVSSENILRNPVSDIHIPPELSLHQMVFDICDKYKDKLAVVRSFVLR